MRRIYCVNERVEKLFKRASNLIVLKIIKIAEEMKKLMTQFKHLINLDSTQRITQFHLKSLQWKSFLSESSYIKCTFLTHAQEILEAKNNH